MCVDAVITRQCGGVPLLGWVVCVSERVPGGVVVGGGVHGWRALTQACPSRLLPTRGCVCRCARETRCFAVVRGGVQVSCVCVWHVGAWWVPGGWLWVPGRCSFLSHAG